MRGWWFVLMLLAIGKAAPAHEFWLRADPSEIQRNQATTLTLHVGEYFEGEILSAFVMKALPPGTHALVYNSLPAAITLPAEKFHAYLHDEGLDRIIRTRERNKTAAQDGRERYRRCAKTLVRAGRKTDDAILHSKGQRLEITPVTNPYRQHAGESFVFRLDFDGRPLTGVLVKAWHRMEGQTHVIRVRTGVDGKFGVTLPFAGVWMLSVVHMIPAEHTVEATGVDWDSFWGSLTMTVLPESRYVGSITP